MENTVTNRGRTNFGKFLRGVSEEIIAAQMSRNPSGSTPEAEWRQLSKETTPIPRESLRGLTYRACQANFLPNSWGLLQHLGQRHRNRVMVSEDPAINPAELAYAIKVSKHQVVARRYETIATNRVSFFGLALNPRNIDGRVRRFSPTALKGPNQQYHRAIWELRDIPFCLEGWDMLQDTCYCERDGVVQGWTRTLTRIEECDRCGDPLSRLQPFEVPSDMKPGLKLLQAIIDPSHERRHEAALLLPTDIAHTDRGLLFAMIQRIVNAIDPEAGDRSFESPRERLNALHQACLAVIDWPFGIDRLTWHDGISSGVVTAIRAKWFELLLPPADEGRLLSKGREQSNSAPTPRRVGLRPATEIARLSPQVLMAAFDYRLITRYFRSHGSEMLPAFDPDEVLAFGEEWRARIDAEAFAYSIGISYHGVEQLVALNVIQADAKAIPGTGPHFLSQTVADFLGFMATPTMDIPAEAVPLTEAVALIGGRAKPWGTILAALMNEEILFALREASRPIERIMISRADVTAICNMTFDRSDYAGPFAERMIHRDAAEICNVSASKSRLLDDLPTVGKNPKTFTVTDVERRAAEIASLPEIASRLRLVPAAAYRQLQQIGFRETMPGGWDRAILASLIRTWEVAKP